MARHQAAIRELSTPVIKVYDRVLLLPIVGTVDDGHSGNIENHDLRLLFDDLHQHRLHDR